MCNSFTSLLANYVNTKHTPLSFASWCMLHIHNSASLRGVCADTPLSFASLVYLLHIHNSAAPQLCIFAYTILSSDVRHYYTTPVVYFAVGDKVISNGLESPIYRPQIRGTTLYMGDFKPLEITLSPTAKYTTVVV